ncbi:MAG: hypothetical protein QXK37_03900 [Candidatus Woesearchaeota archaeon]
MNRLKKTLLKSIKIDNVFLMTVLIDVIYFITLFILLALLMVGLSINFSSLSSIASSLENINKEIVQSSGIIKASPGLQKDLQTSTRVMKTAILGAALITTIVIILFILNSSLFKGLIYARLSGKKFNIEFFKRFNRLNFLWLGIWTGLVIATFLIFKDNIIPYVLLIEMFMFIYFTSILRSGFEEEEHLIGSLKRVYHHGIRRMNKLMLPLFLILTGIIILFLIISFAGMFIPDLPFTIGVFLLFFVFIAWARRYVHIHVTEK